MIDMLNYPELEPDDVVIDLRNQRFKVRQVAPYYKAQSLISQRVVITLMDKSHEIYNMEI